MSSTPTIYFIDDSATMREVFKIAFRRENINVVACHDAVQALAEIEKSPPDIVITDVIMPDKDGYEVCQYIKSHAQLARVPVVLMSGVVNRAVAEKAFAVRADELLRKPFQPQDLIATAARSGSRASRRCRSRHDHDRRCHPGSGFTRCLRPGSSSRSHAAGASQAGSCDSACAFARCYAGQPATEFAGQP